jgi:hypothetical protein
MQMGSRKISTTPARRANPWEDMNTKLTRVPDQVQKNQNKFSHHKNPTYYKGNEDPIIQVSCRPQVRGNPFGGISSLGNFFVIIMWVEPLKQVVASLGKITNE